MAAKTDDTEQVEQVEQDEKRTQVSVAISKDAYRRIYFQSVRETLESGCPVKPARLMAEVVKAYAEGLPDPPDSI